MCYGAYWATLSNLGFPLSGMLPRFSDISLPNCEWEGVYPIRFPTCSELETPKVWACDSGHHSCCLSNVLCAACVLVLKWHRRGRVSLHRSFFYSFPQPVSSVSVLRHPISMSRLPPAPLWTLVALPLSAGCSRGSQDYRGNRMCMAELLGRAARM